jgi:hypothetical protein
MLDQCIIKLSTPIRVKPEIFGNAQFKIDDWLAFTNADEGLRHRKSSDDREPRYHSWYDIFADRALRVYTRSRLPGSENRKDQVVYQIDINPGKILWGHNGRPLQDDRELCFALMVARHALRGILLDPSQASHLIPGLVDRSTSHWHKIEIAMNLRDPGHVVLDLMERMRTPRIRSKALYFDHTTCLKGTAVEMKAYDKLEHMKDKHKNKKGDLEVGDDPVTRLELVLKKEKAAHFDFLPEEERPRIKMIRGKPRLGGFNLDHLKAAHRDYFSDLKGIYHASRGEEDKNNAGFGALLAAIALRWDIPVPEILDLYLTVGKRSSIGSMRDDIERFTSQSSVVTAEELLSDEAYSNQPIVTVRGLGGCDFYVQHYGDDTIYNDDFDEGADRSIREVYMASRATSKLDPSTVQTWW